MRRILTLSTHNAIQIQRQDSLPPFDLSNSGGIVHTSAPNELQIPNGPDPMFIRGDAFGVNMNLNRWESKLGTLPMKIGANTTPVSQIMSPMIPLYPSAWRDAMLTEHAERYTHLTVAAWGWNFPQNGFFWSPAEFAEWCAYVKSWGFFVNYWAADPLPNDPYLKAALPHLSWYIAGEEVDSKITSEQFEFVLKSNLHMVANAIPFGAHFTSNYPEGFPRDTFLTNWNEYDGLVHLMWQANQQESAGTQGARLYYARERVNLGAIGGNGIPAPNSRVYAWETMATDELYGRCGTQWLSRYDNDLGRTQEAYAALRSLELMYTTRTDPRVRPMAGYNNGGRLPDGRPL